MKPLHTFQLAMVAMVLLLGIAVGSRAETPEPEQKEKQTVLGKYVSAQEAYERWSRSPEAIHIIDCRTPEEYAYVGHAPMAVNVPCKLGTWDAQQGRLTLTENPDFEKIIQQRFKKSDALLIMCRSGSRSAASVNRLAAIGFQEVFTIIDGFEGDKIKDPQSYYDGKRLRNGWKNAAAPWTYDLNPDYVYRRSEPAN